MIEKITPEPHQYLIDALSNLAIKKLITKDDALEIAAEAKRRFPEGDPVYGKAVLWQLCKDRGITPDDIPGMDLASAAVSVLRGVLVGTKSAEIFLAKSFDPRAAWVVQQANAQTALELLEEAHTLADTFLEAIE